MIRIGQLTFTKTGFIIYLVIAAIAVIGITLSIIKGVKVLKINKLKDEVAQLEL